MTKPRAVRHLAFAGDCRQKPRAQCVALRRWQGEVWFVRSRSARRTVDLVRHLREMALKELAHSFLGNAEAFGQLGGRQAIAAQLSHFGHLTV